MMDYGHKYADEKLKALEKKLKKEYSKAASEAYSKARSYLDGFSANDKILKEKVAKGEMAKSDWQKWRKETLSMGEHWEDMTKALNENFINANKIAAEMINDTTIDAFAENFNYGTYEVERLSIMDTSFTLYDKTAVKRLLLDEPNLLPTKSLEKKLTSKKMIRWQTRKYRSVITQAIIQGDSIPTIAERLGKETAQSNLNMATRDARTMMTSAQNGGRLASYQRAKEKGITMMKQWIATNDNRTRHTHLEMNGETRELEEEFSNELQYPGDESGDPEEVYNCRCTMVGELGGIDYTSSDLTPDSSLSSISYEDWKNGR